MQATLTSKGQITLPKDIRTRLGLDAGSVLHFKLNPDNTLHVHAVRPDARSVRGLLKSPLGTSPAESARDAGVAAHVRSKLVAVAPRKR